MVNVYSSLCRNRHNCLEEILSQSYRSLIYSLKIYSSVHLIQTLMFKRSNLKEDPYNNLIILIKKVLKSIGFFTFYTFGVKFSLCFCNWLQNGKFNILSIIFMIVFCGFSSLFENGSRITEYCIFTYPRSIEGIWDLLEKLNLVKSIPFARQLIFALSLGTALVLYKNKKEEMPLSYQNFIHLVFGKNLFKDKI